jgi:hypothetical protein
MFENQLVANPSKSIILAERSPLTTLKVENPSLIVHQEITLSSVTSVHNCGELLLNSNINFICLSLIIIQLQISSFRVNILRFNQF